MSNDVSGDTLVIFSEWNSIKMFLLNWHECAEYRVCDQQFIDLEGCKEDRAIEHLGYMLGVEPYFGPTIPPLKGWNGDNYDPDWQPGKPESEPAPAPWASRLVEGPVVNFRKVIRVIRTGWY